MDELLKKLGDILRSLEAILKEVFEGEQQTPLTPGEKVLLTVRAHLGTDASPMNLAPKELSCAEGVANILNKVYPSVPRNIISTNILDKHLSDSTHFKSTKIPKPGSVIMSPRQGTTPGHCGFFLTSNRIASNSSKTGLFEDNYSLDSWVREMRDKRKLKIYIYEPL